MKLAPCQYHTHLYKYVSFFLHLTTYILYFGKSFAFMIPDIRAHKQTRFKKTYLFMIYERLRSYSHLPYQVANNGINCYDIKRSKYPKFFGTQLC